jgi:hypothetical protein
MLTVAYPGQLPPLLLALADDVADRLGGPLVIAEEERLEAFGGAICAHWQEAGDAVIVLSPSTLDQRGVSIAEALAHELGHLIEFIATGRFTGSFTAGSEAFAVAAVQPILEHAPITVDATVALLDGVAQLENRKVAGSPMGEISSDQS